MARLDRNELNLFLQEFETFFNVGTFKNTISHEPRIKNNMQQKSFTSNLLNS